MPDIPGVVPDGPIRGKDAGPGDVDKGHPIPALPVGVGCDSPPVGVAVAAEVGQQHILVGLAASRSEEQPLGQVGVGHLVGKSGGNLVQHPLDILVVEVYLMGAVALLLALVHLLGGHAEEEDILVPQLLVHLHIGAVQGADGKRAVHHELHVAGAAGLLAGGGYLLGNLRGGHQLLGQ